MIYTALRYKKPDAGLVLNGALAGLVGVTAGANQYSYLSAIIIGAVLGVVMILAVGFIDCRLKIDDPVGAISVHGVCGSLGTIAIGLFSVDGGLFTGGGVKLLGIQLLGVVICLAVAGLLGFVTFYSMKKTMGIRVDLAEEKEGLDMAEHGTSAYTQ